MSLSRKYGKFSTDLRRAVKATPKPITDELKRLVPPLMVESFDNVWELRNERFCDFWKIIPTIFAMIWEKIPVKIVRAWKRVQIVFSEIWTKLPSWFTEEWDKFPDRFAGKWDKFPAIFAAVWLDENRALNRGVPEGLQHVLPCSVLCAVEKYHEVYGQISFKEWI